MFVLTNMAFRSYLQLMASPECVDKIRKLYPLLYFSCHEKHERSDDLTERDLRILHHVSSGDSVFASVLARHLGLSRSTMSEALASLERRGLIERTDAVSRRRAISLTRAGESATVSDDGLDSRAIGAILDELNEDEQTIVVRGLELIAQAIERMRA